ncbi:AAA family ATPase [Micromonospora zhanjiangensis]
MLTRLEVQGFKNLVDVAIDFGPFTCIAGANGMGKSNVFDAIEFLSYLAAEPLVEASQRVRGRPACGAVTRGTCSGTVTATTSTGSSSRPR